MNKIERISVFALVMTAMVMVASGDDRFGWRTMSLDIHMKLSAEATRYVEDVLSPQARAMLPHNEIDFAVTVPHITLYMTSFVTRRIDDLVVAFQDTAAHLLRHLPPCNVTMARAAPSGQFYLWHSTVPACLQNMSNALVEALAPFRDVNQTVPKWIEAVPEPQRSEMAALHRRYGSPGVFDYFDPHVTLAWDAVEPTTVLNRLAYPPLNMTVSHLAVGVVTRHGAVLRNRDLIVFPPMP